MKLTLAIAFSLSLFTTSVGVFASNSDPDPVQVAITKQKNHFVFNINKSWRGASVEVISANGVQISQERLYRRKMVIDFGKVKAGNYTVRVSKGNKSKEFQYIKK
jgi:hypothetical protein